MKDHEVSELLYQALETEQGGVKVYQTAIRCAVNDDLKKEWEEYLQQTQNHVRVVEKLCSRLGVDPATETPGRLLVRHIGESLVKAMEMALDAGKPEAAEIVAVAYSSSDAHPEVKDGARCRLCLREVMRSEVDQFVSAVAVDQDRNAFGGKPFRDGEHHGNPCAPLARAAKPTRERCGQQHAVAIRSGANAPNDVTRASVDDARSESSAYRRPPQPLRERACDEERGQSRINAARRAVWHGEAPRRRPSRHDSHPCPPGFGRPRRSWPIRETFRTGRR